MKPGESNDGWYWIWDDPSLSVYEKAVAQAIVRRQYRGNAVALTRETIAALASMSRRQVIYCEESLKALGILRMEPTKHQHVFLYRVSRGQAHLFDGRASVQNPVENVAGNTGSAIRPEGSGAGTVHSMHEHAPPRAQCACFLTENLKTSNSKPGAEVRADSPSLEKESEKRKAARQRIERHLDWRKEQEDRSKIEARDKRVSDGEIHKGEVSSNTPPPSPPDRFNRVSSSLFTELRVALNRLGQTEPRRMSEREIEERRELLREQARKLAGGRA